MNSKHNANVFLDTPETNIASTTPQLSDLGTEDLALLRVMLGLSPRSEDTESGLAFVVRLAEQEAADDSGARSEHEQRILDKTVRWLRKLEEDAQEFSEVARQLVARCVDMDAQFGGAEEEAIQQMEMTLTGVDQFLEACKPPRREDRSEPNLVLAWSDSEVCFSWEGSEDEPESLVDLVHSLARSDGEFSDEEINIVAQSVVAAIQESESILPSFGAPKRVKDDRMVLEFLPGLTSIPDEMLVANDEPIPLEVEAELDQFPGLASEIDQMVQDVQIGWGQGYAFRSDPEEKKDQTRYLRSIRRPKKKDPIQDSLAIRDFKKELVLDAIENVAVQYQAHRVPVAKNMFCIANQQMQIARRKGDIQAVSRLGDFMAHLVPTISAADDDMGSIVQDLKT